MAGSGLPTLLGVDLHQCLCLRLGDPSAAIEDASTEVVPIGVLLGNCSVLQLIGIDMGRPPLARLLALFLDLQFTLPQPLIVPSVVGSHSDSLGRAPNSVR
jgi:hypothetical protein